jgi:large subunit ribosomal protein L23
MAERPNRDKQYAFEVALDANKIEIKKALQERYPDVTIQSLRTAILPTQRVTRMTKKRVIQGTIGRSKKAIITLAPGQAIDFYENV